MSQSPKKSDTYTGILKMSDLSFQALHRQRPKYDVNVQFSINTDYGKQVVGSRFEDVNEDDPVMLSLRDRLHRDEYGHMKMDYLEVIESGVISRRLNPYLEKHGYTFGMVNIAHANYWGLISISGIDSLSLLYENFGRAFDAAIKMIAGGDVDGMPGRLLLVDLPRLELEEAEDVYEQEE